MTLTYDNYLEHYGVKGMKWGVRKGESKKSVSNERYERIKESQNRSFQVTSKSGDILDVEVNKPLKLVNWIASKTDKATHDSINSPTLNLLHNGKNVGDASIQHVSKDELNLVWLGINPKHRGKGYASAAFDSAVEYGKQKGYKKLTLEVPGYSPDARHIYEKRGFKVVKEPTQKELQKDYIWGGLTHMSLDLDSIRHSSNYDDEFDEVLLKTFTQMSEEEWNLVFDDMEHSITYDNYLEHYGVKGMKWGVRKSDRPEGVSKKTNREAKKDAKEFARAKMFYGEGAGNRRKLIKNSVDAKASRDPSYKKAFDHHLDSQDMSKHASKARTERRNKDVRNTAAKTARGVKNLAIGAVAPVTITSMAVYYASQNPTVRKHTKAGFDKAKNTFVSQVNNHKTRNSVQDWAKRNGFG